jgi:hypothetical protein
MQISRLFTIWAVHHRSTQVYTLEVHCTHQDLHNDVKIVQIRLKLVVIFTVKDWCSGGVEINDDPSSSSWTIQVIHGLPWITPKPFGWTFPGCPFMVQLDGHWAMDEFGTLFYPLRCGKTLSAVGQGDSTFSHTK